MQLKIGDRVRYTRTDDTRARPTGTIGLVVAPLTDDSHPRIKWPGENKSKTCAERYLEHVDTAAERAIKDAHDYYTRLTEVDLCK